MANRTICKVARLQLRELYDEQNKLQYPYEKLRDLNKQVALVKNRTVQLAWEWNNCEQHFYAENQVYPKKADFMNNYKSLAGYAYGILNKDFQMMYSKNLNCSIRIADKAFEQSKVKINKGEQSVLSYRADCPLEINREAIKIRRSEQEKKYTVSINVFSKKYSKEQGYRGTSVSFAVWRPDVSRETILKRCISREYKIGASKLIYSQKKKCWFLDLAYEFTAEENAALYSERIMGVDLGIKCVAYMGFKFCEDRYKISPSEVNAFRAKTEARKRSLQRQGKYCGEGRIGHGYATRNQPVLKINDAIQRFRDTANHKYSRYIVDQAVKHGCGTIQMEELKDISKDDKFLKDWTYFDLQQKIKYKAEEAGIKVRLVDPKYTSQRCSRCGYIDAENRPKEEKGQAYFRCKECGFSTNADYNASLNLATEGIENIIKKTTRAKRK